jgi:hypothetical protein
MIPTRASDLVRCARGRQAGRFPGRPVPVPTALILRGGRLLPRDPRWPAHDFAEADYHHGNGPIRLRLVHVEWARPVVRDGHTWHATEGVVLDPLGREVDRGEFLIRAERIPAPPARKRPNLRRLR